MEFNRSQSRIGKAITLVKNYKALAIPISQASKEVVRLLKIRSLDKSAKVMLEMSKDEPNEEVIKSIIHE